MHEFILHNKGLEGAIGIHCGSTSLNDQEGEEENFGYLRTTSKPISAKVHVVAPWHVMCRHTSSSSFFHRHIKFITANITCLSTYQGQ